MSDAHALVKSLAETVQELAAYSEGDTLSDEEALVETLTDSLAEVEA